MKVKLITTKFRPDEDEFVVISINQYRNKDGYWVFQLIFANLGINITPLFIK